MTPAAVRLSHLTLGYRRHPAVHHLSGAFEGGSMTAVVGPNGAGKSTLLKGIVGALKPLEGSIRLEGVGRKDIAYLPQQADLDRTFPIRVADVVSMGLWRKTGMFGTLTGRRQDEVRQALSAVGLEGFEQRPISTLSGGQLQRTLFARVLLQDAPVILLDEPFTAIDAKTQSDLLGLIHRWHGEKRTVIAVLHDLDCVREHFPATLLLARTPIAWCDTREALRADNLLKARAMSERFEDHARLCAGDAA
ncbi:MAG: ABC transporter ATP-binding protein [Alphaproteobacteria bacterium]|nr:ABC transporter ATP-binding protein [Alphaproteobacteria bacterium]